MPVQSLETFEKCRRLHFKIDTTRPEGAVWSKRLKEYLFIYCFVEGVKVEFCEVLMCISVLPTVYSGTDRHTKLTSTGHFYFRWLFS